LDEPQREIKLKTREKEKGRTVISKGSREGIQVRHKASEEGTDILYGK